MLNGEVGLSPPQSEPAATEPSEREVWVEFACAVDQRDGGIEILPKIAKRKGGTTKDVRVVPCDPKRLLSKSDAALAVGRRVLGPADNVEHLVAMRRQSKRRAVPRIALNCLTEQFQRLLELRPDLLRSAIGRGGRDHTR